jgi:hypothetical protein
MFGKTKLYGFAIRETTDGKYELVDLDDSGSEGGKVFAIYDEYNDAYKASKEKNKTVKEQWKALKKDGKTHRVFVEDVLQALTSYVEGMTADKLNGLDPNYSPNSFTLVPILDSDGNPVFHNGVPKTRKVPNLITIVGVKRDQDGRKVSNIPFLEFHGYDNNGKPVFLPRVSSSKNPLTGTEVIREDRVYEVETKKLGHVIAAMDRGELARALRLYRKTMSARREANKLVNSLLGESGQWLNYLPNYIHHAYKRDDKETLKSFEKRMQDWWMYRRKFSEESPTAKARFYPTYYDAAVNKGMEPVSLEIDETMRMWANKTYAALANKVLLSHALLSRDIDGSPLLIPRFNVDEKADEENPEEDEFDVAMPEDVIRKSLENAVAYFNMREPVAKRFVINAKVDPRREWNRLNDWLGKSIYSKKYSDVALRRGSSAFKSVTSWKASSEPKGLLSERSGARNLIKFLEDSGTEIEIRPFGGRNWAAGINRYNQWSKNIGLGLSVFHPVALAESLIGIGGFTWKNMHKLGSRRFYLDMHNQLKLARVHKETTKKWIRNGAIFSTTNPNLEQTLIDKDLISYMKRHDPGDGKISLNPLYHGARAWKLYNEWMNKWLWSGMFPAIKLYAMEHVYEEMTTNFDLRGVAYNESALRRDIASLINDAFGGQNWDKYLWATPAARQWLHMIVFAPDWTISALNISGVVNLPLISEVVRPNQSMAQRDWQVRKYWPGMVGITMTMIPQAIQAAIYMAFGGDPDEGDSFWIGNNEQDKNGVLGIRGLGGHIDITPLVRKLGWVPVVGYKGGETGKRRVYLRFAKQATEVFEGWAQVPFTTAMNKSSAAVRTAWEQMTGSNTAQWDLGFKDGGLRGFLVGNDGSIFDSRFAYIGRKFIPMSIMSVLDGRPTTFFAPTQRGQSKYVAVTQMTQILEAYANKGVYDRIASNPEYMMNLEALAPEVLNAARRNGYEPVEILKRAKSHVLSGLYKDFFIALNNGDFKELDDISKRIIRVGGKLESLLKSMELRAKSTTSRRMTPEMELLVRQVFYGKK